MSSYCVPDMRNIVENKADAMKPSEVHVPVGKSHRKRDFQ